MSSSKAKDAETPEIKDAEHAKMRRTSLTITARQVDRLEREATRLMIPVSEVVRRVLDAWIDAAEESK